MDGWVLVAVGTEGVRVIAFLIGELSWFGVDLVVQFTLATRRQERGGDDCHDAIVNWLSHDAVLAHRIALLLQDLLEVVWRPLLVAVYGWVELFVRLVGVVGVVGVGLFLAFRWLILHGAGVTLGAMGEKARLLICFTDFIQMRLIKRILVSSPIITLQGLFRYPHPTHRSSTLLPFCCFAEKWLKVVPIKYAFSWFASKLRGFSSSCYFIFKQG